MTPEQKRIALVNACIYNTFPSCLQVEGCPMCGVCTSFAYIPDKTACELYAEAVKRGTIKEE
jgi:hypothetical protein